jgi:hypothetical protein
VELGEVASPRLGLLAALRQLVVQRLEAQERPHLEDEGRGVDGLVEEVVGPGLVASPDRHGITEGGHHDHRQGRAVYLAQPRARLEAAHAGEANVQEDEIEGLFRSTRVLPTMGSSSMTSTRVMGEGQCCAGDSASQARRAILADAIQEDGLEYG